MATLDLKPLSKEIIQKMGYSNHDLWMVKLDDEIFGPFEVESLKHYAHENEKTFLKSYASRLGTSDWQPFFSHAHFQPIAPHEAPESQRYWILNLGQKAGPFSRLELEKKIELGVLTSVDLISSDDGYSWKKLFHLHEFLLNDHSADTLPQPPTEASFQEAREIILEKLEGREEISPSEGLAGLTYMTHQEKMILKLDEIDLKSLQQPQMSASLKWAVPTAVASVGVIALMGYSLLSGPALDEVVVDEAPIPIKRSRSAATENMPKRTRGSVQNHHVPERQPASYQRSGLTQPQVAPETYYPSHVETHQEPEQHYPDPAAEQADLGQAPEEHSLVSHPPQEGQTLDGAMGEAINGEVAQPAPEPAVEEVSDF